MKLAVWWWLLASFTAITLADNTTVVCTDEEAIHYMESLLSIDVLYLSRGKSTKCRAKVAGMER